MRCLVPNSKEGFWGNFTAREDRLIADGLVVTVLGGLALASAVSWILSTTASSQHAYLDTFFWIVAGAPAAAYFLLVVLPLWLRRRKTWFPVPGS